MRILLAVDGSPSSDRAVDLLSTFDLPADSQIRVVAVRVPDTSALAMAWAPVGIDPADVDADTRVLRAALDTACARLARDELHVETVLVDGRPGSVIVDEAIAFEAELIVVGSRGHGRIETMLLGSTAAEVVDHAPCPVLVARGPSLDPIVLADDGSEQARHAEEVLARWPLFRGREVTVVTVAEIPMPLTMPYPSLNDEVLASYAGAVDDARDEWQQVAAEAARRLAGAGLAATPAMVEGEPATELVRHAKEHGTGTIVMGTRGHTGLARLILGSTARNVLLHAPCSVLVVRAQR